MRADWCGSPRDSGCAVCGALTNAGECSAHTNCAWNGAKCRACMEHAAEGACSAALGCIWRASTDSCAADVTRNHAPPSPAATDEDVLTDEERAAAGLVPEAELGTDDDGTSSLPVWAVVLLVVLVLICCVVAALLAVRKRKSDKKESYSKTAEDDKDASVRSLKLNTVSGGQNYTEMDQKDTQPKESDKHEKKKKKEAKRQTAPPFARTSDSAGSTEGMTDSKSTEKDLSSGAKAETGMDTPGELDEERAKTDGWEKRTKRVQSTKSLKKLGGSNPPSQDVDNIDASV